MLKQLTLAAAIALTSSSAFGQLQELRGSVTDAMCGKKHMMKNASAAECTRACIKSGSDYALVVGDKLYTLKGDKTQLDKFAGANVLVKGEVKGSIVSVREIKPAT